MIIFWWLILLNSSINLLFLIDVGLQINSSGYLVTGADGVRTNSFALTDAWDNLGATIPLNNLTMNAGSGTIKNVAGGSYDGINISYSYQAGETSFIGVNDTIGAMQTVPDLLGLIVLITMVGIILAVVFNVVPTGRTGGA